ncbi:DUF998 domain-containing protein [[Eubacterium] cellulosolvens]
MSKNSSQLPITLRLAAVSGIIGPIIFAVVVFVLGQLRPRYNHFTQTMSELGEVGSQNAMVMNIAGLGLLGILMIVFSFSLRHGLTKGMDSKFGSIFVAVAGASLVGTAFFPCDPGCVNESFSGKMHDIFASIPAVAIILALILISNSMRADILWQKYWTYTLATGILTILCSFLLIFSVFEDWSGLVQRFGMGIPLLWMMVIARANQICCQEPS